MKSNTSTDQIRENAAKAADILADLKEAVSKGQVTEESLYERLRRVILLRLMVEEEDADTDNLRNLCVLSIRRQTQGNEGMSDHAIGKQIEKYDCHQTNLVAQKKVLLMLFIERSLGIHLDDDESADIATVRDLAEKYCCALKR